MNFKRETDERCRDVEKSKEFFQRDEATPVLLLRKCHRKIYSLFLDTPLEMKMNIMVNFIPSIGGRGFLCAGERDVIRRFTLRYRDVDPRNVTTAQRSSIRGKDFQTHHFIHFSG